MAPAWPERTTLRSSSKWPIRRTPRTAGPSCGAYATFRIPVYWIVDLNRRIVEVRTRPFGKGKQAGYARCDIYREGDQVPVELDGQEVGQVAVSDLLP